MTRTPCCASRQTHSSLVLDHSGKHIRRVKCSEFHSPELRLRGPSASFIHTPSFTKVRRRAHHLNSPNRRNCEKTRHTQPPNDVVPVTGARRFHKAASSFFHFLSFSCINPCLPDPTPTITHAHCGLVHAAYGQRRAVLEDPHIGRLHRYPLPCPSMFRPPI